jgi:hypothetical protein
MHIVNVHVAGLQGILNQIDSSELSQTIKDITDYEGCFLVDNYGIKRLVVPPLKFIRENIERIEERTVDAMEALRAVLGDKREVEAYSTTPGEKHLFMYKAKEELRVYYT